MTSPSSAPAVSASADPALSAQSDRRLVWLNGRLVPPEQATLSVWDHAALFGDGVFEGLRAYNGRVFKLQSHVDRLFRSAATIRLNIPYTNPQVCALVKETLAANERKDAYIRLVATRGPGSLSFHGSHGVNKPNVFCIVDELRIFSEAQYEQGVSVVIAQRRRVPPECLDPSIKSLNYLNNILANQEAHDAGCPEAIMLNIRGEVAEGTGDNVFVARGGVVATPPVGASLLDGITRAFTLELCRELGVKAVERAIMPVELFQADEVFLTGTAVEVAAVARVNGSPVGAGKEGPITRRLRDRFREIVASHAPED